MLKNGVSSRHFNIIQMTTIYMYSDLSDLSITILLSKDIYEWKQMSNIHRAPHLEIIAYSDGYIAIGMFAISYTSDKDVTDTT